MALHSTDCRAEQALTRDTVPVVVDAVVTWARSEGGGAVPAGAGAAPRLDVFARAALREVVGSTSLAALLDDHRVADQHLRDLIVRLAAGRGVTVRSAEIRAVGIPQAIQDRADERFLLALCLCQGNRRVRGAEEAHFAARRLSRSPIMSRPSPASSGSHPQTREPLAASAD